MTRRTFLGAALAAQGENRSWSLIFEERFADAGFRSRWMLEGEADITLMPKGSDLLKQFVAAQSNTNP